MIVKIWKESRAHPHKHGDVDRVDGSGDSLVVHEGTDSFVYNDTQGYAIIDNDG